MADCNDDQNPPYFSKDPDSVLDWRWDWRTATDPWLAPDETITTSTWTVTPAGELAPDPTDHGAGFDDTTATIWLVGGVAGKWYEVTNRITTSQGRTEDKTRPFLIEHH